MGSAWYGVLISLGLLAAATVGTANGGGPVWSFQTGEASLTTPIVITEASGDGTPIVLFAVGEHVLALDGAFGEELWDTSLSGRVNAIRSLDLNEDGVDEVLVATGVDDSPVPRGRLYSLDPTGGSITGCLEVEGTVSALSVGDFNVDGWEDLALGIEPSQADILVLGIEFAGHRIEAVDGRIPFGNPVSTLVDGPVGIGASPSFLLWTGLLSGSPSGPDSVQTGDISGDGVPDVVVSEVGSPRVRALSGQDGSALWAFSVDGESSTGLSIGRVSDRAVVVVGKGSRVIAVDGSTGSTMWTRGSGTDARTAIHQLSDATTVFVGGHSAITAHNLLTGEEQWNVDVSTIGFSFPARQLLLADVMSFDGLEIVASLHKGALDEFSICGPGGILVLGTSGSVMAIVELSHVAPRFAANGFDNGPHPEIFVVDYCQAAISAYDVGELGET